MQHRLLLLRNFSTSWLKIAKLRRDLESYLRRKAAPAALSLQTRRVQNNPWPIQRFSSSLNARHAETNTTFRSAQKKKRDFKRKLSSEERSCQVLNERQSAETDSLITDLMKEQQMIPNVSCVLLLVDHPGPIIRLHAALNGKSSIKDYKILSIEIPC